MAARIRTCGSSLKGARLNPMRVWSWLKNAPAQRAPHPGSRDDLVSLTLALLLSPLAAATLLVRVAVYGGLSFHAAALLQAGVTLSLAFGALALAIVYRRDLCSWAIAANREALVWTLAACALAALSATCLHRSDMDDVIYLPKVLYLLAHPEAHMDGLIPELAHAPALTLPLAAAPYYPTSYEFVQAAFAYASGIDFLEVYYALTPCAAAAFGVLFIVLNLRLLGLSARTAAICAALLVPLILLMGESHRSFGNFTLVRMFQAKCAFLFVGLQAWIAVSLLFFKEPKAARWVTLLVGALAVVGITTTALIMLPLLGVPLFVSWWCTASHRRVIPVGVAYGLALLPVAAFAFDYRRYALERAGYGSDLNAGFPNTFIGQLHLLTGESNFPAAFVAFALAVGVCLYSWRVRRHAFLLLWTAITIALYLNPWSAPVIMKFVATENIYWRLFYLLPIPLMIGMALGYGLDRIRPDSKVGRHLPWLALVALGVVVAVSPTSVTRKDNRVRIGPPGLTLGTYAADARDCLALAKPGTVLAPEPLALDMVLLSANHTQVLTRLDFLKNALFNEPDEFNRRNSAAKFIMGEGGLGQDLADVLQHEQPGTVVIAASARAEVEPYLASAQYRQIAGVGGWMVFDRAAAP